MSNTNQFSDQAKSLNRFQSAVGGESLDGIDLESPEAKEAMASILLCTQDDSAPAQKNMSVTMVKKALGLGF